MALEFTQVQSQSSNEHNSKKRVVIGLGNTILSDDGIGIFVSREVAKRINQDNVEVVEASLAGFNLMDLLMGYDEAIIIDSIKTNGGKVGDIYQIDPDSLSQTVRLASVHDLNLATALEFSKMLNLPIPNKILIYAVEVMDNTTFKEGCCEEVAATIPSLTELVLKKLNEKRW